MGFGQEKHKVGIKYPHPQREEQPQKPHRGQGLCLQVSTVLNCTHSEVRKQIQKKSRSRQSSSDQDDSRNCLRGQGRKQDKSTCCFMAMCTAVGSTGNKLGMLPLFHGNPHIHCHIHGAQSSTSRHIPHWQRIDATPQHPWASPSPASWDAGQGGLDMAGEENQPGRLPSPKLGQCSAEEMEFPLGPR